MCGIIKFHSSSPMLKYCKISLNTFFFGSLSLAFASIRLPKSGNDISLRIEESLNIKVGNRIDISNAI